jgi:hypothetical protein
MYVPPQHHSGILAGCINWEQNAQKKSRQIVYRYLARQERTHAMNANQILLVVVLLPLLIVG